MKPRRAVLVVGALVMLLPLADVPGRADARTAPAAPTAAEQPADPRTELGIERSRLHDTAVSMTATLGRQAALAKRLAAATSQQEALPAWQDFVATVHEGRHDAGRAIAALGRVEQLAGRIGLDPKEMTTAPSEAAAATVDWFRSANLPADLTQTLAKRIGPAPESVTLPDLRGRLQVQLDRYGQRLLDEINWIGTTAEMAFEAFDAAGYAHDTGDPDRIEIQCGTTEDNFIICVVAAVIEVVSFILDRFLLDDDTDTAPRRLFLTAPCGTLLAMTDRELITNIEHLSLGPTLDDDERAILRLFSCLPCDRLAAIRNSSSILHPGEGRISSRLLYDFDGAEWDRLMVRLRECGLVNFPASDDDASRLFINSTDCAALTRLPNADLRVLLLHLFSGSTGDDDEAAIIRLIECLPLNRVAELLRMPRLSYDDFDDSVDGSEWTRLSRRLDAARRAFG